MFGLKVRIDLVLQVRFDLQARKALVELGLGLRTRGYLAVGLVVVHRKAQVGLDFVLQINFVVLGCLLQINLVGLDFVLRINLVGLDFVLRINLVEDGCGLARRLLRTHLVVVVQTRFVVVVQTRLVVLDQTRLVVLGQNRLVVLAQNRLVVLGQNHLVVLDQNRLVVLDQNRLVVFDQNHLVEISLQKTNVEEQHLVDRTNFACLCFASFVQTGLKVVFQAPADPPYLTKQTFTTRTFC